MDIYSDYYNIDTGESFKSDDLPKLYPSLFFDHIKELAQKINTFDSGMLCASSLEAYHNAAFIKLYEVCRVGTQKQYMTSKKHLATWNELSLKLLGKVYTLKEMEEIGNNKIAELGYKQLSVDN